MNGDFDRVNWDYAAGMRIDPEGNTGVHDGQVERNGAPGGYGRVRNADEAIGRAIFGDSASAVRGESVSRTFGRQPSRRRCPGFIIELLFIVVGLLAYSGIFVLASLWLGGLMLLASLDAVNLHFRIVVIVLLLPTYPLVLAPVVLFQMICDKLR